MIPKLHPGFQPGDKKTIYLFLFIKNENKQALNTVIGRCFNFTLSL
jgi:hypothetical protein